MEGTSPASNDRGKQAAAVSNAIAGLHRTHYGRGPTRARTVTGSDYVICFLEEVYTPVERTLIEAGRFDTVRETRNAFQDTMREAFSAKVEQVVGRKVIGFLSQVHINPDLSIETFILEPDGTKQKQPRCHEQSRVSARQWPRACREMTARQQRQDDHTRGRPHSERPLASPRTMQAHERGDQQAIPVLEHDWRSRSGDQRHRAPSLAPFSQRIGTSRSVVVMSARLQGRGASVRFFAHASAPAWAAFPRSPLQIRKPNRLRCRWSRQRQPGWVWRSVKGVKTPI